MGGLRSKDEHTAAIKKHFRAVAVINTRSRRGRRLPLGDLAAVESFRVMDPSRLPVILDRGLDLEPDLLIVGGGDGTLSQAVRHLAHKDVALGVLPLGTTNNFARSLGLPLDLPRAIQVIREGKVADIDLGEVDGHLFANLASFGVSAEVAGSVRPMAKRLLGRAAYPLRALSVLPGHRPFKARLTADGKVHQLLTHQLNIANGRYHGGWQIARDISIDNSRLVAYQLGSGKRLRLLAETLSTALTGRTRNLAGSPFLVARELHLETEPAMVADVDGELLGRTPVTIRSLPNALRVMVPPDFDDR